MSLKRNTQIRIYKELQIFDKELIYSESEKLLMCFEHFKKRYDQRYKTSPDDNFTYKTYWQWIIQLREYLVSNNGKRMTRFIGNYIKEHDKTMYKVIYTKYEDLNIFIPLTILPIDDSREKSRLYKEVLKNKKKKC